MNISKQTHAHCDKMHIGVVPHEHLVCSAYAVEKSSLTYATRPDKSAQGMG